MVMVLLSIAPNPRWCPIMCSPSIMLVQLNPLEALLYGRARLRALDYMPML